MKRNRTPTEYQEQCTIFEWCELMSAKYPMLKYCHSSLNGVKLTIGQAHKAKLSGMKKGVPDIFLPYNNGEYTGLFIELKRVKQGVVKPEQKDFIAYLNSQGYKAVVCKGSTDAILTLKEYLDQGIKMKQNTKKDEQ